MRSSILTKEFMEGLIFKLKKKSRSKVKNYNFIVKIGPCHWHSHFSSASQSPKLLQSSKLSIPFFNSTQNRLFAPHCIWWWVEFELLCQHFSFDFDDFPISHFVTSLIMASAGAQTCNHSTYQIFLPNWGLNDRLYGLIVAASSSM